MYLFKYIDTCMYIDNAKELTLLFYLKTMPHESIRALWECWQADLVNKAW